MSQQTRSRHTAAVHQERDMTVQDVERPTREYRRGLDLNISIRMPACLVQVLDRAAEQRRVSRSRVIREWLERVGTRRASA